MGDALDGPSIAGGEPVEFGNRNDVCGASVWAGSRKELSFAVTFYQAHVARRGINYSIYLVQIPIKFWIQEIVQHVALGGEKARFLITTSALIVASLILFKTV